MLLFFVNLVKSNMEKKIVYCCSCFIDNAVWFTENMSLHTWELNLTILDKDGQCNDNVFVYETSYQIDYNDSTEYLNNIIFCCVECFEFILRIESGKDNFQFDDIDCNYVYEDTFCFDFQTYYGNDHFQFDVTQPVDIRCTNDILRKYFTNAPEVKSCFTSLQKYYYNYFCFQCRDFFKKVFLRNLYKFENGLSYLKKTSTLENL